MQDVELWGFLLLAWQKSWVLQKCEKSDSSCICIGFCVFIIYTQSFIFGSTFSSLAADIVEGRLEAARKVGADVVINCSKENLKEAGNHALQYLYALLNDTVIIMYFTAELEC